MCLVFAEKETMGSVEVYDYDKMQWVPYVPDFNKWIKHFEDISAGRVRPDYKGGTLWGAARNTDMKLLPGTITLS